MKRLSGLWTLVKAFMNVSVMLSNTPDDPGSEAEPDLDGRDRIVAFQSWLSRNIISRPLRRRRGCRASRVKNRFKELARRCVKSVLKRSPVTYSILCLPGRGGTAHAGYSKHSWLYKKTK